MRSSGRFLYRRGKKIREIFIRLNYGTVTFDSIALPDGTVNKVKHILSDSPLILEL